MGSSRRDVKRFTDVARSQAGRELLRVQRGESPTDFKPMSDIGSGVYEIRVHTQTEHRVIYIAKYAEAVYVLHAFKKRARKTAHRDLEIARRRRAEVERSRRI
jgi:phage-related protein